MAKVSNFAVSIDYLSVLLVTVTVTFVLWLFPMLLGKYADLTYPYIAASTIVSEIITIEHFAKSLNSSHYEQNLPPCPTVSPHLQGFNLEPTYHTEWSDERMREFAAKMSIKEGGVWQPSHCSARFAATVVVGVRNREKQLQQFLQHMHSFLSRQLLRYRMVVVEQNNSKPYNRGKIFNIGFVESLKLPDLRGEEHCYIFHDVDLLPLHDQNMYACTSQPRHMSVAVDTFRFQLPYRSLCGGAIAIQAQQYRTLNGFSNKFDGWGGEDDDFCSRIQDQGLDVVRFDPHVSSYTMLPHKPGIPSPRRFSTLQEAALSANSDGLKGIQYTTADSADGMHPLMVKIVARW